MWRQRKILFLAVVASLGATIPAGAARLVALSTARAVSEGTIPQGVTDSFPTDAAAIHAVGVFADAAQGTKVRGVWVAVDAIETPNYEVDAAEVTLPAGEGRAHFQLSKPNRGWPPGQYRLDLYVDGVFVTSAGFRVEKGGGRAVSAAPAAPARPTAPPAAAARPGGELLGAWSCQVFAGGAAVGAGAVSFSPDGWVQVGQQRYAYQAYPRNVVRLQDEAGYSDYGYSTEGGGLWMWAADGSEFRCEKSGGAPAVSGQSPSPQSGSYSGGYGRAAGGGGGEAWRLRGTYCHWGGSSSGSSGYSHTERITFDGQGRWTFGSESSFSSGAGMAYGGGGGDSGTYRVAGRQIFYQTASGEQGVVQVNMQQDDGRITEILVDGELYAPQLCE